MTIRTLKILTLARLAVINDAWEKGKTLHDLADAHGVSISVLKARLRYYLGLEKTGGGMPTVHPKALAARNKAAKENRLKEYHAALAALPLPECESYGVKPRPYYAEWSHKTGAQAGNRKGEHMTNDLEHSIIAQLIEVGLLARFGDRDPEGAKQAREAVRAELLANGWSLPPYTDTAHDFRHAAMHRMADWPILAQLVAAKKSAALRLDSRTVAALYADAGEDDWAAMSAGESEFATVAINAHPAPPYTQEDRQEDAELNDLADARQGSPEIPVSLDDLE